jgi:ribosomal protein L11 methyltransferase
MTHRYELPLGPGDDREVVAARLWAAGAAGVWETPPGVVAWFATADADVPAGGTWSVEQDRDWQAEWKATIGPVTAGRVVIVPSWLATDHPAGPDDVTIVLDPGQAFGSGHHATTTLCLELLQDLDVAGRGVVGQRVLDVGTGSGVLAIAAALLGAEVVDAVDVDADAVAVAARNAAANGVALTPEARSVTPADGGRYDVVLANLVTDTVAELAGDLTAAVVDGGALIVSGITVERRDRALDPLQAAGCDVIEVRERDGWVGALLRRFASAGPGTRR